MNGINVAHFMTHPDAPCAAGGKSPTVDLSPKPKAGISLAVDRFTENVDSTREAMAGFCEAMMGVNAAEVLPRRRGWLARWRELRALRRECRAMETPEAALRRRLRARDEQIGVLKKRVGDLLQKLDDERSLCATLGTTVSQWQRMNQQVTDAAFRINEERSAMEVTAVQQRNRAEHFAARFHALTAENARLREELAVSEAARLDVIGGMGSPDGAWHVPA